jgi:nucleotide-binding universal stress UspA family protein
VTSTYFIAVDGSGPSMAALRWGILRAAEVGVPVVLLHVVDDEWGLAGRAYAEEAEQRGEDALARGERKSLELDAGVAVTSRLLRGSPVWELAAAPSADDLLVIGTHKTGFLHGRVLGSRSISIVSLARCSVAVIPDVELGTRRGVVAGVGWPEVDSRAIASAAREAARLREEAVLIHSAWIAVTSRMDVIAHPLEAERSLLRSALDEARKSAPEAVVSTRISRRSPPEALLDASRRSNLLVLGSSESRGPRQSVLGTTTHDVLMNINCPALISRNTVI